MLCENPACGNAFEPVKHWQKFCSPACRSAMHSKGGTDAKAAVRFMVEKLAGVEQFLAAFPPGDKGQDAALRDVRSAIRRGWSVK
jgi:hypothetical protein